LVLIGYGWLRLVLRDVGRDRRSVTPAGLGCRGVLWVRTEAVFLFREVKKKRIFQLGRYQATL